MPQDSGKSAPMAMRLGEALAAATDRLVRAGVDAPRHEARLLAAHLLGIPSAALLDTAATIDCVAFFALIARREAREPLAFITGRRGFWTLDLAVTPVTLVPRADTETLIEAAIAARPDRAAVRRVLDLGTGTGCLLLAALAEFPHAFGFGVDISPAAATLARHNAALCGLRTRAAFLAADWATALHARFDLILCNPPYIESGAIAALQPEIASHEPLRALDGGPDGLGAYRRLVAALPHLLTKDGIAVLELGAGQGGDVARLAAAAGLTHIHTRPDLGGIDRAVVLGWRP